MPFLNDFYCPRCHTTTEALTRMKTRAIECPKCGGPASFVLTAPRIKLDGTDPSFTTAYDRWAKVHEQEAARARKREDYGGTHHGDN